MQIVVSRCLYQALSAVNIVKFEENLDMKIFSSFHRNVLFCIRQPLIVKEPIVNLFKHASFIALNI